MADDLSADLASLRIDREDPGRPRRGPQLLFAAIGLAALAAGVYFIAVPAVRGKLFKTKVTVSEIVVVSPSQASIDLTSTGYIVPQRISVVAAKVGGRVLESHIKQGQVVKAGDVLVVLESTDQAAALAAAKTKVAAAHANVDTARANLAEIEQQLAREKKLSERGVSPGSLAEDLEKRVASLKAAARAAEAAVKTAEADARTMSVNLENYTLASPISGTILNRPPELGEMIGPAMGGIASQVGGIEIADMTSLVVETDVPEARLHMVKMNGPAEIILDAYPERRYRGQAYEVVPKVNRAKATVIVKVRFTDENTGVLPEMSARVSFLAKAVDDQAIKLPPITVVPKGAVVERQGGKMVYALEGSRVRMMPIEVGGPVGIGFELRKGPPPGTRVVNDPPEELADGEEVKEAINP